MRHLNNQCGPKYDLAKSNTAESQPQLQQLLNISTRSLSSHSRNSGARFSWTIWPCWLCPSTLEITTALQVQPSSNDNLWAKHSVSGLYLSTIDWLWIPNSSDSDDLIFQFLPIPFIYLPSFIDFSPAVSTSALFCEISQLYIASNSNIDLAGRKRQQKAAGHEQVIVDGIKPTLCHPWLRKYVISNLSFMRAHAHYEDRSVKRLTARVGSDSSGPVAGHPAGNGWKGQQWTTW